MIYVRMDGFSCLSFQWGHGYSINMTLFCVINLLFTDISSDRLMIIKILH